MMAAPRGPANVPTLTEVVLLDTRAPPVPPELPPPDALSAQAATADEARLVNEVLADVQRQVDLMLERRLRDALAPALARVSDVLIRQMRDELAVTLRDIVAHAVAQEIARHRER